MATGRIPTTANSPLTAKGDLFTFSTGSAKLAVGSDGDTLVANSATATGLEWQTPSSGAITWTQRLAGTGDLFNSIAYNGSDLYVAVGENGTLYSSPDALTWTSRTSGFGVNEIHQVAYGNALWVAVGVSGTLTTSPDGITWTARTSNMGSNDMYDVVYDNSIWVAVGTGGGATNTGGLIYSTDGITWTRKSQTPTVGTAYHTVVYNGTNWIIGGTVSTNNFLYASAPSGTWTAGATTSATVISAILWDGTRHIIVQGTTVGYNTSVTLSGTTTSYFSVSSPSATFTTKNFFKLYSNLLYRFTVAMQTYVPVSTAHPSLSVPLLLPTTTINSSNGLASGVSGGFVGAAGIIISDNRGRIYTSF
jgi:hypothetical protein